MRVKVRVRLTLTYPYRSLSIYLLTYLSIYLPNQSSFGSCGPPRDAPLLRTMKPLVMAPLPLLAVPGTLASTRLQPASSLAAHRNGCTPVWVGPPQKAVGGQARSNAW